MATIKLYTDIPQSKRLAEILPLESADMYFEKGIGDNYKEAFGNYADMRIAENMLGIKTIPCWSLAALLNLLPNEIVTDNKFECHYQIDIRKYDGGDKTTLYQIAYGNNRGSSGSWHDMINTGEKENLIDCCVQIILSLYKIDLL